MAGLFLIRKSMENYLGPYSLAELKEQYRQMEFGLQDEIAGSFGKWIALDNVPSLKRNYPEIARLVQEDFLGGWTISESTQKKILKEDKKKILRRKSKPKRSTFSLFLMLVLVVLFGGGFYLYKQNKLFGKLLDLNRSPEQDLVEKLINKKDLEGFDQSMEQILPKILPKITHSRNAYNDWIPYVRYYAFRDVGQIDGLKTKLLRGMEPYSAPADCSLAAWQNYWLEGKDDWQELPDGRQIFAQNWSKILLWDTHWIRRRGRVPGWVEGHNYYLGCVVMARKAFGAVRADLEKSTGKQLPAEFDQRLGVIQSTLEGKSPPLMENPFGILGFTSCVESASTKAELDMCKFKESFSAPIQKYLKSVYARNELRLFLQKTRVFTDESLEALTKLQKQMKSTDEITDFSYLPEIKYVLSLVVNQGSIKEAQKKVKFDFPEVDFSNF